MSAGPRGLRFQFIGFDELAQFTQSQYRYLFSRLRRLTGTTVPQRMRAASNPDGPGVSWVHQRFIVEGKEAGRPFIPALATDNPHLDVEEYRKSLAQLDPVTRARLEYGDWTVRPAGAMFQREWFRIVGEVPPGIRKVRYWDLAATEAKPGKDPDWTAGVLVGLQDGVYYVLDICHRRGTPGDVERVVRQTAAADGPEVTIYMEQEPGASGVAAIDHYARHVLVGFTFYGERSTGPKSERARPVSSAAEEGNVRLLRGPWIGAFLDEVEAFPIGDHDDQVDALSGAMAKLARGGVLAITSLGGASVPPTRFWSLGMSRLQGRLESGR